MSSARSPESPPNLSLLMALSDVCRRLLLARAGLGGAQQLDPAQAAARAGLSADEARALLLAAFARLRQAPLRLPLLSDRLYGQLLERVYGQQAKLTGLDREERSELAALGSLERMVVVLCSGLGGVGRHSYQETGELLGLPAARVRHVLARSLRSMAGRDIWARMIERIYPWAQRSQHPAVVPAQLEAETG